MKKPAGVRNAVESAPSVSKHFWQAILAVLAWTVVLLYAGVPLVLAILIPIDVALVGLAVLRWRAIQT